METEPKRQGWAFGVLITLTCVTAAWLVTRTGGAVPYPASLSSLLVTLVVTLPVALLWMTAAYGLGWPLCSWLLHDTRHRFVVQLGLGVCTMPVVVMVLGTAGLLQIGGGVGAWVVVAVGVGATIAQAWRTSSAKSDSADRPFAGVEVVLLGAAPPLAVLLVASASAPGWLWQTEFGGYDVLSYHLQLPKEWANAGQIETLQHNVYSFLPSYVEGVYYHLRLLCGEGYAFAYTSQYLHMMVVCAGAVAVARLALEEGCRSRIAALVGVLVLSTPWMVVIGSLAYNEGFVVLALATGLIITKQQHVCTRRRGLAIGLLIGAACGAKLTAIGFVALPLVAIYLWRSRWSTWKWSLPLMAAGVFMALGPYLVRNGLATGNPVFPFATSVFGQAHFSDAQVERWNEAHSFDGAIADRVRAVWRQLLWFGFGEKPPGFEDIWRPQWSILWWVAGAGFVVSIGDRRVRRGALQAGLVVLAMLAFWLLMTHLKSRFMIPAIVPLSLMIAFGIEALHDRLGVSKRSRFSTGILTTVGLLFSTGPLYLFLTELRGAPAARIGMHMFMTGEELPVEVQRALAEQLPSAYVNTQLPETSRVLMIGEAAPLYYTVALDYATTWDRGPLDRRWSILKREGASRLIEALRDDGYTHALLDLNMLSRWDVGGSRDPSMPTERILQAFNSVRDPLASWPERGVVLFDLRDRTSR